MTDHNSDSTSSSDLAVDRRAFIAVAGGALAATSLTSPPRSIAKTIGLQDSQPAAKATGAAKITKQTILEAEKLAKVSYTDAEREQVLHSIGDFGEIYDALRAADLQNGEGPAAAFDPRLEGMTFPARTAPARYRKTKSSTLPTIEEDIAFASIADLGHWLRTKQVTSEKLTQISIKRFKAIGPKLESVITLMEDEALGRARRADREMAKGIDRGPLHGVPFGVKDLYDSKNVRTTWGAAPYKDRVPDRNAAVVDKLYDAGAVLVAKLTMGALAYGDIWFGGKTRNPWNLEQGSSGSSAGSAASVAAGLCSFTLGTETYGSIASPSARCGATGYRPTFGRVSRDGAMALCWSLDKAGPLCRSVDDCAYVLDAIAGYDPADDCTVDLPLNIDMTRSLKGLRVGYLKDEFESKAATDADADTLKTIEKLGGTLVPKQLARAPYGGIIFFIISVEGAAAFDTLTRDNLDDQMKWQDDAAWPNTFRTTRLASAVEFMQARRLRRRYMDVAAELFDGVDVLIAPRRHGALHALTNMTGQPAVTIRQGFRDDDTPYAITMWGRLYGDSTLLAAAGALEREFGLWTRRPPIS